ncbi:MAG TPA: hypothetical protein VHA57_00520 [Actinomycetota bacterium]|nr:hypothetical protein [Actinomycetota bacterium]
MGVRSEIKRRAATGLVLAVGLGTVLGVPPASADPHDGGSTGAVVSALSTAAFGPVLTVGGSGPLAGAPLYAISSDDGGHFGCTTVTETTFQGDITCTGPESDFLNGVQTDEWPAFTTTGHPVAGPGVKQWLLGVVWRPGIGAQVTYAGHPLYLFDPPSNPFVPFGQHFLETVAPLPPWHGLWSLVSASHGTFASGPAVLTTEILPGGSPALAVEEYPNAVPGGVSVTVYSFAGRHDQNVCRDCDPSWIPVLTQGPVQVDGSLSGQVGAIRTGDGTWQATYNGQPLYLYASEEAVFGPMGPAETGTQGNGASVRAHGGTFEDITP